MGILLIAHNVSSQHLKLEILRWSLDTGLFVSNSLEMIILPIVLYHNSDVVCMMMVFKMFSCHCLMFS